MKTYLVTVIAVIAVVSCEKPSNEVESKLKVLEEQAREAVERQRELESELLEQKLFAERDAIERERTLIELERAANAAEVNQELDKRRQELAERESRAYDLQNSLESREKDLTGLESELSEKELELAGREPLTSLPLTQRNEVSGVIGDFSQFYEPLSSFGSWFQTRDYGYVYQPAVVREESWRPYTRGRWAFTNHGWTWVSSEPFGWACYHYGRWALLENIGWVWVPGSQWSPAWVSWRESSDYIGWAPLPPQTMVWNSRSWDSSMDTRFGIRSEWYSFVSYRYFGSHIQSYCQPVSYNHAIYQSCANITNYQINGNDVYVSGPRYLHVSDRIGKKLPIYQLRMEERSNTSRGGRQQYSQFSGNELRVVAPRVVDDRNRNSRPSRVSRDLGEVVVDRDAVVEPVPAQQRIETDRPDKSTVHREQQPRVNPLSRDQIVPEAPVISGEERHTNRRVPNLPTLETRPNHQRPANNKPELPKGVRPLAGVSDTKRKRENLVIEPPMPERSDDAKILPPMPLKPPANEARKNQQREEVLKLDREQQENVRKEREQQSDRRQQQEAQTDAARKQRERELRQQQEQQQESRRGQQKEQMQRAQVEQQEQQQRAARQQQESQRAQREEQQKMREQQQQEQQERAARQQQESQRAQREEQQKMREQQQQEQQERAARQQQESQRAQREEQQKMREQQQQEQQERAARQQQESQRAQQEQQERAARQQEEAQRAQRDQQERQEGNRKNQR